MRELTKSTFSAGLAMSLFGMQQMMNVLRRQKPGEPNAATESFNSVTQTMIDRTGETLRETFHAGDKVQRGLVDLTFRVLSLAPLRPSGAGSASSMVSETTRQAAERLRKWMGEKDGSGCSCRGGRMQGGAAPRSSMWTAPAPTPPVRPSQAPNGAPEEGWGPVPAYP